MARVCISSNAINSYGTRILTSGMDLRQYKRNPVLLYMHRRGNVIGYVDDVRKENDTVTGELVFDEVSELSRQCKQQFEFGSLKMVSAGIDIIEMSTDSKYILPGQSCPTITKSKLFEVSVVDIGANDDAIVLTKDGKTITLGKDGENPLPKLHDNPLNNNKMEHKEILKLLGLPETATAAEITDKIELLKAEAAQAEKLRAENQTLVLAAIESAVDKAIEEKRIPAGKKDEFLNLGKEIGTQKLQSVLAAMNPAQRLSDTLHTESRTPRTYSRLGEVPASELPAIKRDNPEEYRRLYMAEYGFNYEEQTATPHTDDKGN